MEEKVNLVDSETDVFLTSEVEKIESMEMSEDEDFSDDFPAEELPDRKSIYIENELKKEIEKEEEDNRPE